VKSVKSVSKYNRERKQGGVGVPASEVICVHPRTEMFA